MPIPQLPPELTEKILQNVWHDVLSAWERIQFMKACPLVNREWRALYDVISSRDVYIPSMQYLHYLLCIIASGRSHVHVPTSRFAVKTRNIIVQRVELGDAWRPRSDPLSEQWQDQNAQTFTYRRILSASKYTSFNGVHLCFPAASHIIFEVVTRRRSSDGDRKYTQLRVRLDGNTTLQAQWRVNLGYRIEPDEDWTSAYQDALVRSVRDVLDDHMGIDLSGFAPHAYNVRGALTLEPDNVLILPVSWEPRPFPRFAFENLDLYFKRAAVGYYSFCKRAFDERPSLLMQV